MREPPNRDDHPNGRRPPEGHHPPQNRPHPPEPVTTARTDGTRRTSPPATPSHECDEMAALTGVTPLVRPVATGIDSLKPLSRWLPGARGEQTAGPRRPTPAPGSRGPARSVHIAIIWPSSA